MDTKFRFAEEIVLLLLSEDTGDLDRFSSRNLNYVLAGATLMDLALEDRIDNDLDNLILVDATPLGDPLLDPTLADIAEHPEETALEYWVERVSTQGDSLRTTTLTRLVRRSIIESDEEGLLFLSSSFTRTRRYPGMSGDAGQEVRSRIMRLLFSDDIPDPKDIVIVSLVHACQLFENLLTKRELDEVQPRIELLAKMDLIGQAVFSVLSNATQDKAESWGITGGEGSSKDIPKIKGMPIIGNALDVSRDMNRFLVNQYQEHGPIFRIKLLNEEVYVLAGPEANEFVSRYGNLCLTNHFTWIGYNNELNITRSLINMDGPEHAQLRRALAYCYSRTIYEKQISAAFDAFQNQVKNWEIGEILPGYKTFQVLIIEQIGRATTGYSGEGYYDDFIHYMEDIMNTTVVGTRPKFLYQRRMNKVGKRLDEFCTMVLNAHLEEDNKLERSVVSEGLDIHRQNPVFLKECDLLSLILSPFLAGLDTAAGTCCFAFYALLTNPDLMARARAEADELFANGKPSARDLRAADIIHRVALETMRIYPIAPALMRHAANSFVFNGYRVDAGKKIMVASTVPHFLPEYYPDPEKFDIDRFLPERAEHKQRHVYAPFGLGAHRCLGSGFAGPLIAVTLAALLRYVELAINPPNYKLKIKSTPTARPSKKFKMKVVKHRE